jgi:hypothetical protein
MAEADDDAPVTLATTDARITQIAVEQWGSGTPDARMTKIVLEQWASVAGLQTFSARHV